MIGIIDYNVGNLASVVNAFEKVGHAVKLVQIDEDIESCTHLVLPGVGAFDAGIKNLRALELEEPIRKFIDSGKPFLGICLGMQLLFNGSDESEDHIEGMGIIPGRVKSLKEKVSLYVPHVGWNDIVVRGTHSLLESEASYYFVHSFYCECVERDDVDAQVEYDFTFDISVKKDNVYAVQFHPEKSHQAGLDILKKFGDLNC